MKTLNQYILRDLLKTFGLSLLASTGLLALAGGIFSVISKEGFSAAAIFKLIPLLIPLVITVTMPLSALFAASQVYGRLAADNELTACRAAGISVHRLLWPSIWLAVFVTLFCLLFLNFVFPGMFGRVKSVVQANVVQMAELQLKKRGFIRLPSKLFTDEASGKNQTQAHYITVRGASSQFDRQELVDAHWDPDLDYLKLDYPTWVHLDGEGAIVQYASAELGWCQFDATKSPVELTVYFQNARTYRADGQSLEVASPVYGPQSLNKEVLPQNPAFEGLGTLMQWRRHPWMFRKIDDAFIGFRKNWIRYRCNEFCHSSLANGGEVILTDAAGRRYAISAKEYELTPKAELHLTSMRIVVDGVAADEPSEYSAAEAFVKPDVTDDDGIGLTIVLRGDREHPVKMFNPQSAEFLPRQRAEDLSVKDLSPPVSLVNEARGVTREAVFDGASDLGVGDDERMTGALTKLRASADDLRREIIALYHFRFGFAFIAPATIILAAALGIIFRGSHGLVAFGLAFIPFISIFVLLLMGRSTGEKVGKELLGAAIIWGGLGLMLFSNAVVLRLGVRR